MDNTTTHTTTYRAVRVGTHKRPRVEVLTPGSLTPDGERSWRVVAKAGGQRARLPFVVFNPEYATILGLRSSRVEAEALASANLGRLVLVVDGPGVEYA